MNSIAKYFTAYEQKSLKTLIVRTKIWQEKYTLRGLYGRWWKGPRSEQNKGIYPACFVQPHLWGKRVEKQHLVRNEWFELIDFIVLEQFLIYRKIEQIIQNSHILSSHHHPHTASRYKHLTLMWYICFSLGLHPESLRGSWSAVRKNVWSWEKRGQVEPTSTSAPGPHHLRSNMASREQ